MYKFKGLKPLEPCRGKLPLLFSYIYPISKTQYEPRSWKYVPEGLTQYQFLEVAFAASISSSSKLPPAIFFVLYQITNRFTAETLIVAGQKKSWNILEESECTEWAGMEESCNDLAESEALNSNRMLFPSSLDTCIALLDPSPGDLPQPFLSFLLNVLWQHHKTLQNAAITLTS